MRKLFNSDFRVTQAYGVNKDYYKQFGLQGHEGIDLVPTSGSWDVLCLEDGVVVKDENNPKSGAYGNNVTIWHPKFNKATQYCHLASNTVQLNQSVTKGQVLGVMGNTGNTSGAHVHINLFETTADGIRKNRQNGFLGGIDPFPFLNESTKQEPAPPLVVTEQTRLPMFDNKEQQQVKAEYDAKDRALADYENKVTQLTTDAAKLILDFDEYKKNAFVPQNATQKFLVDIARKL